MAMFFLALERWCILDLFVLLGLGHERPTVDLCVLLG